MNDYMENNSLFFFYLFLILSPMAVVFGIKLRKFKNKNYFLFFEYIFIFICLIIASFQDSEPHYLLGITKFQEGILLLVGMDYVIDSTDIIETYKETKKSIGLHVLKMHHIPAYIGIAYILYVRQCGGIIIRLLFDSFGYILHILNFVTKFKYKETLSDLQEIAFFALRVCYYSIFGVYGIYIMIFYWSFIDKILFIFYVIWTLIVLYEHIYRGFILKNRFRLKKIYYKWIRGKNNKENSIFLGEI